jgi:hypothetical protein
MPGVCGTDAIDLVSWKLWTQNLPSRLGPSILLKSSLSSSSRPLSTEESRSARRFGFVDAATPAILLYSWLQDEMLNPAWGVPKNMTPDVEIRISL